ncbi:MAG: helix-turn-helix domain-containing protein [Hyellaceae cyanobacterium CSU_1_1]|nr:helix-turn-helix domain-containing protein [Hyellaceae cyanobacterium CSU_1_1]
MNQDPSQTNKEQLQNLMHQAGIADINELSQVAKVARLQLMRIQQGLILNISVGAIAQIAQALNVSVDNLLKIFVEQHQVIVQPASSSQDRDALAACRQEYQKLQQEMNQLQQALQVEFQQDSLETIESWLLQWPTAATAVRQNPQLPATRLLSLVEPIEELIKHWNVSTIATVGEELAYDPQNHQLMKGIAQPGELVKVRYVGYKQGDKLLYKAKVSPV